MVQTTQAASNPLLVQLPGMSSKKSNAADAIFSIGKPKTDSKSKAKGNEGDVFMALAACAAAQPMPTLQDVEQTPESQSAPPKLTKSINEIVGNLEGTQNLSGEMLAEMFSQLIGEAEAGDEKAQAWFNALLARMPETSEWNQETLAQFLNENLAEVQSGPYPLETANNPATAAEYVAAKPEAPMELTEPVESTERREIKSEDIKAPAQDEPKAAEIKAETPRIAQTERTQKDESPKAEHTSKSTNAPEVNPFVQAANTSFPAEEVTQTLQQSIASQVTDAVAMAAGNGKDSLSIQMKPDFLGNLSIQLTLGNDGLIARIRTENPEVQSVISAQLNDLANALREKGVQVVSMEVVYTHLSDQFGESQSRSSQQDSKHGNVHVVERVELSPQGYDGWLDTALVSEGESVVGTVEYTA